MVPSLSRRQLLTGGGAALGGSVLGIGAFAPTWFPDFVTDLALQAYPSPPNQVWEPSVSAAHADDAVARLEATVGEAKTLWERVETEEADRWYARTPDGGHLESAKEESNPRDRLRTATTGIEYAGQSIGHVKVALEEVDTDALVERGEAIRAEADTVLDSFSEYRVSDPGRDLGYLYVTERMLSFARLGSYRSGTYTGDTADTEEYREHDIARTWGEHLQAQQRLRTARQYRDQYRDGLDENTSSYVDVLDEAAATLSDEIDTFPTREAMRTAIEEGRELTQETPYGVVRWQLFTRCYDDAFRFGFAPGEYQSGHRIQHVLELGQALLARRAHAFALDDLDVTPETSGYDSGDAFRAKRRAVREYNAVRDRHDSPFAGVLMSDATSLVRAAGIGLGRADDERPAWHERVEAAVYSLVGLGQLRELGDVLDVVLDGSDG